MRLKYRMLGKRKKTFDLLGYSHFFKGYGLKVSCMVG